MGETENHTHESLLVRSNGLLIAFEGIDGAGKTTQAKFLFDFLQAAKIEVVTTREPTNSVWGQKIRKIAQEGRKETPLNDEIEYFIKDRQLHVSSLILPEMNKNKVVITDRYYYSTIAYQGALGADVEHLKKINEVDNSFPKPDRVYYLSVPPEEGISRIHINRDVINIGYEREDFLRKVKTVFDSLTDDNFLKIDGTLKPDVISGIIRDDVMVLVEKKIHKKI